MRIFASFLAAFVAAALIGCSSGSGGQSSSSEATTAPEAAASGGAASMSEMPMYPGAKTEAAGSTGMTSGGTASGKVLSTADSFDKVYKWYQDKMPSGSEKSHMAAGGSNTAVFMVGEAGNQQSVTITTSSAIPGKTMITIAKVAH